MTDTLTQCLLPEFASSFFSVSRYRLPDAPVLQLTQKAQLMLARAVIDGTTFRLTEFSVGCGGFYPECPQRVRPINPVMQVLEHEVYRTSVAYVYYGLTTTEVYCRIPKDEAIGGLGELGIWTTVLVSPFSFEIGSSFLFAVQHFPLRVKTHKAVETFKVELTFSP